MSHESELEMSQQGSRHVMVMSHVEKDVERVRIVTAWGRIGAYRQDMICEFEEQWWWGGAGDVDMDCFAGTMCR